MESYKNELQKLAEENKYNPLRVGKAVLEALGFEVELNGFGYNSLEVIVKKDSQEVFLEVFGS